MKSCPTCQRTYPDDAPGFCVNDGTRLVAVEAQEFDPQKTILASTPPPPQQYSEQAPQPNNPPAPPQYSAPPPPNNPPAPPTPQQAAWQPQMPPQPPPQQPMAQNYGGGYAPQQGQAQAWPPPYAPQAAKSKGLSLITLVLGLLSAIGLTIVFLIAGDVLERYYYLMMISFWGSAALGVIALIVGIMALLSKRQRGKWMAIIGVLLGLPAIAFCIYALISQPEILSAPFG